MNQMNQSIPSAFVWQLSNLNVFFFSPSVASNTTPDTIIPMLAEWLNRHMSDVFIFRIQFLCCLWKQELEQISCEAPDEYYEWFFASHLSFRLPRASCITQLSFEKYFCFSLFHSASSNSYRSDWHFNTHYFRSMFSSYKWIFGCTTIFVSEHSPCSARLLMLSMSHPQHVSVLYMWKTCISLRLATLFALYCAH